MNRWLHIDMDCFYHSCAKKLYNLTDSDVLVNGHNQIISASLYVRLVLGIEKMSVIAPDAVLPHGIKQVYTSFEMRRKFMDEFEAIHKTLKTFKRNVVALKKDSFSMYYDTEKIPEIQRLILDKHGYHCTIGYGRSQVEAKNSCMALKEKRSYVRS